MLSAPYPSRRLRELLLGGEELLDRLAAGSHQQVAEVVEVAVEERPADAGATHDLVDG